ncbi:MAG: hypothetical protein JWQ95_7044 [Sphaerisporangium sp.]|nr:hypothetical protein [Sphaerisporangium sp.]
MGALCVVLGGPPVPNGSWERRATYVSTVALRRAGGVPREVAEELAIRLRLLPGVLAVEVRPNGFLVIEVAVPGDIVREILAEPVAPGREAREEQPRAEGGPWADFPRTWGNPGFVVKYAYVRTGAVQRWAHDLGVWDEDLPGRDQDMGGGDEDLGSEHDDHVLADGEDLRDGEERHDDAEGWDPAAFRPELLVDPRDRAVLRLLAELPSRRGSRDPGWQAYLERLAEAYHDAFEHAPAIPKGDEAWSGTHVARLWMARAVRRVLAEGLTDLLQTAPHKI